MNLAFLIKRPLNKRPELRCLIENNKLIEDDTGASLEGKTCGNEFATFEGKPLFTLKYEFRTNEFAVCEVFPIDVDPFNPKRFLYDRKQFLPRPGEPPPCCHCGKATKEHPRWYQYWRQRRKPCNDDSQSCKDETCQQVDKQILALASEEVAHVVIPNVEVEAPLTARKGER